MPIIFAQAIMFIPVSLTGFFGGAKEGGLIRVLSDNTSFWYNFIFALLIVVFTYFYTAITINPTQMADDLKRNNGFIPGIKPGKQTRDYLDTVMDRITLPELSSWQLLPSSLLLLNCWVLVLGLLSFLAERLS